MAKSGIQTLPHLEGVEVFQRQLDLLRRQKLLVNLANSLLLQSFITDGQGRVCRHRLRVHAKFAPQGLMDQSGAAWQEVSLNLDLFDQRLSLLGPVLLLKNIIASEERCDSLAFSFFISWILDSNCSMRLRVKSDRT